MGAVAITRVPGRRRRLLPAGAGLAGGVTLWLSILVLLPIAAVVSSSLSGGLSGFWHAATGAEARSALELTLELSFAAVAWNAVVGTAIAWVLVRDSFPGKRLAEGLVDLPFALPTIVAGLTLIALYGPRHPLGIDVAYTRWGIFVALLFVTLPFGVRAVQPVLLELDADVEAAAASLGARPWTIVRRIILPSLRPAILSGMALAFARALGEFGAITLIAGNQPFKTEYASVFISNQIESGAQSAAAAVSVCLLVFALVTLLLLEWGERRAARHG